MLIFGVSGYSKVVHDAARAAGVKVAGFVDPSESKPEFAGLPVCSLADALAQPSGEIVVAVTNPRTRKAIAERFTSHGWTLRTLVHPRATVASDAKVGPGSVVLAGAVIQSGAMVGTCAIVNANAMIDFDATLADYSHAALGAAIGSQVKIGEGAWVGLNACVLEELAIGAWSMIGAGATVVEDVPNEVVVYGVPAKVHRQGSYFADEAAPAAAAANNNGASNVRDTVADVINTILRDTGRETRAFANQDILMGNIGLDSLDLAVMTVSLEQRTGQDPFRSGRGAVRSFGELVAVYEDSLRETAK
jgi:sugar O-acyltransferase (sialic acid O-acetyltransferase NeuD family)